MIGWAGRNAGFVPYLQIGENRHKPMVRTIHKHTAIRLFFPSESYHARERVADYLECVAEEMVLAVSIAF